MEWNRVASGGKLELRYNRWDSRRFWNLWRCHFSLWGCGAENTKWIHLHKMCMCVNVEAGLLGRSSAEEIKASAAIWGTIVHDGIFSRTDDVFSFKRRLRPPFRRSTSVERLFNKRKLRRRFSPRQETLDLIHCAAVSVSIAANDLVCFHSHCILLDAAGTIEIPVLRHGSDLSSLTSVWCATRPADPPSASPGVDYIPSSKKVEFKPGKTQEVSSGKHNFIDIAHIVAFFFLF